MFGLESTASHRHLVLLTLLTELLWLCQLQTGLTGGGNISRSLDIIFILNLLVDRYLLLSTAACLC